MSTNKDTIYIDVDDEITSIIDKVQNAQEGLVALVLPKRAAMLQSSVNMKLLKRAAEKSKKNLVLITTEAGLLPLAGSIGLYVAKNLQSKPEIPKVAAASSAIDELAKADEAPKPDFDPKTAAAIAVGELAADDLVSDKLPAKPGLTPLAYKRAAGEEESVMLDNNDKTDKTDEKAADKEKKDKKLKVPNFERFRTWLIIAVVVIILLIIGFIFANKVLPKALVTISTNTSAVSSNLAMTLSPTATTLNTSQLIVPANLQQTQQTASKQVATTGQKNEGQTATGKVSFTATICNPTLSPNQPSTIPTGTGISSGGMTFITQQQVVFPKNGKPQPGNCWSFTSTSNPVTINAQNPGSSYNLGANSNFTTSFQDSDNPGDSVTTAYVATGSTSGGTDNNVQVVSQTDITNATTAITMPASSTTKATLTAALTAAGYDPIVVTYNAGTPAITNSANAGDQANTVTVTETITYTMFGAKESYLSTLITNSVDQQINTTKQSIQDTGLSKANYSNFAQAATQGTLTMQTSSTIGPHLNIAQLKVQIAGMKKGDLESTLEQNPGVTGVTVKYSPFWVSGTPKNVSKITIVVKKAK
jgi:hypothetical protein